MKSLLGILEHDTCELPWFYEFFYSLESQKLKAPHIRRSLEMIII